MADSKTVAKKLAHPCTVIETTISWTGQIRKKHELKSPFGIGRLFCEICMQLPNSHGYGYYSENVVIFSHQSGKRQTDNLRGSLRLEISGGNQPSETEDQDFTGSQTYRFRLLDRAEDRSQFSLTIRLINVREITDALARNGLTDAADEGPTLATTGRSLMQEIKALKLEAYADAWLQGSDGPDFKVPCLKFVLGIRSPTFAAMFRTEAAPEATTGVVVIKEYDSVTLATFWNFLLKDDTTGWREGNGEMAISMLALGDCYLVKRLKNVATETLAEIISDLNALAILVAADLHNIDTLLELALCHIGTSRNFEATEIEELPKQLRIKVVDRLLRGKE